MPAIDELDLVDFDYLDPQFNGERYHRELLALRDEHWIVRVPLGYLVLDREAGEELLRSRRTTFPGMKIAELFGIEDGPLYEEMQRNILHLNGEDHRRLRNLVNPFFTPRAADRWRPTMRTILDELWASVDGACEAVADLAKPYPSRTIAAVMGAADSDAPRLHHWSNVIQKQFDAIALATDRAEIDVAVAEFYEWAHGLLERRRGDPREDLVSALLAAEEEGDRLSDVECVNLVLNVLVGGVDTTQAQLTHALRLFAAHPDQWALLAERPELAGQAVEEIIRYEPITPITARIVLEDIEVRGVTFPRDSILLICAFTANRDDVGNDFDITADRGRARPLTFGAGIHYCLGANLARAELEEALAFLAPRMPGLRLDGEAELESITGIYGVARLPLSWSAAA
jgi:cytochrome P450